MAGRHIANPAVVKPFQTWGGTNPKHRAETLEAERPQTISIFEFRPRAAVTHVNSTTITPGLPPGV